MNRVLDKAEHSYCLRNLPYTQTCASVPRSGYGTVYNNMGDYTYTMEINHGCGKLSDKADITEIVETASVLTLTFLIYSQSG